MLPFANTTLITPKLRTIARLTTNDNAKIWRGTLTQIAIATTPLHATNRMAPPIAETDTNHMSNTNLEIAKHNMISTDNNRMSNNNLETANHNMVSTDNNHMSNNNLETANHNMVSTDNNHMSNINLEIANHNMVSTTPANNPKATRHSATTINPLVTHPLATANIHVATLRHSPAYTNMALTAPTPANNHTAKARASTTMTPTPTATPHIP
jgi:hypothetical protein